GKLDSLEQDFRRTGNYSYSRLEEWAKGWREQGPLQKALGGLGVAMSLYHAGDDASKRDYLNMVQHLAEGSQDGLELVAGATRGWSDAGKLSEYLEKFGAGGLERGALRFSEFAARFAPALGVAANGLAAVTHGMAIADDRDPAGKIGDAVSVVGDS